MRIFTRVTYFLSNTSPGRVSVHRGEISDEAVEIETKCRQKTGASQ